MKLSIVSIGLLAAVTPLVSAWSKDDREIFRVRDEIATYEGPEVTFYDILGVAPSASQDDINKAYRKKSRSLHPDKVKQQLAAERTKARKSGKKDGKPGVNVAKAPTAAEVRTAIKNASDRQARLSIVTNILRGPGRERYDHFLANGFPVWKGTGYYYSRYRPGFGTVVVGVFLFVGGAAHYIALYMSWKRQREFVGRYIKFARHAAWGENLGIAIPGVDAAPAPAPPVPAEDEQRPQAALNRKQRRMQERETKRETKDEGRPRRGRRPGATAAAAGSGTATPTPEAGGPTGAKKRVVAENGKILVVDSLGDVYLEQEDEDGNIGEFLLDPNEIPQPSIKDTALYRLPVFVYRLSVGRLLSKDKGAAAADEEDEDAGHDFKEVAADTDDSDEPGKRTPSTAGSGDDGFELLDKSVSDLDAAAAAGGKATGSQAQQRQGKGGKRKGKRR